MTIVDISFVSQRRFVITYKALAIHIRPKLAIASVGFGLPSGAAPVFGAVTDVCVPAPG